MSSRKARLAVLGAALLFGIAYAALGSAAEPQRRGRTRAARPARPARPAHAAAVFSHRTAAHGRACETCHTFPSPNWKEVRAEAFPDVTEYPTHGSCLGCHREQFFARERPAPGICSVCHVAVTPRFTARLPFPNPSDTFLASERGRDFTSEFEVYFPHEPHLAMMGAVPERPAVVRVAHQEPAGPAGPAAACATCHQTYRPQGSSRDEFEVAPPASLGERFWLKKGTFQTSPTSHESCFTCHAADSGLEPTPSKCATCHRPSLAPVAADFDPAFASSMGIVDASTLRKWKHRDSSATFRHEGGLHPELACATCHDVAAMNTVDARTTRVRVASCGGEMGCHITATIDALRGGALNFELERRKADATFRCAKCHLAYGAAPVPASHLAAVAALGAK